MDIQFKQTFEDWYNYDPETGTGAYKDVIFPTVQCTEEHFGNTTRSKELFDSWASFSLLCPDIKNDSSIKFYNKYGDMVTQHFTFTIEKCQNTTENNNHCHPPEEIDRYT